MTPKIPVLFAAVAVLVFGVLPAAAQQTQMKYDKNGRVTYGPGGPNRVIQQGPNTRVYITTRSWLDAGTEVLPGDRKFQDYAFPPAIGYPDFARENLNRPIDRQPLNPPSDMGGYPLTIPIPR
jgi:hypothetical protein